MTEQQIINRLFMLFTLIGAGAAHGQDTGDLGVQKQDALHFTCRLDHTFFGNVRTPGQGSGTSSGIIAQSEKMKVEPPTIQFDVTPSSGDGGGVATKSFLPDRRLAKPLTLAIQNIRVANFQGDSRSTLPPQATS